MQPLPLTALVNTNILIMSEEQKSWGGARKGAGRPKKGTKYYNFMALPEVDAILSSLEGNKSEYINNAILAYAQNKK